MTSFGTSKRAHGVGERAESLHVADVEHDEEIDVAQRRRRPCAVSSRTSSPSRKRNSSGHGVGFTMRTSIPRCASNRASAASEPQPSPSAFMCVDSATRRPGTNSRSSCAIAARRDSGMVRKSRTLLRHRAELKKGTAPDRLGRRSKHNRSPGVSRPRPGSARCRPASGACRRGSRSPDR